MRTFTFPRPRPRGLVGRKLETYEQAVLALTGALTVILTALLPGVALKLTTLVWLPAAAIWATFAPYRGRTYLRWWEIKRTYRKAMAKRALLYKSPAAQAGTTLGGVPKPVPVPAGVPALEWFKANTPYGELAVLLQPQRRLLTASIEIEGERDFGGLDESDRESALIAYEHFLTAVTESGGRVRRLAFTTRINPSDPNAHARDARARREPSAPGWLHESYDDLQRMVAVSAEDRRLFLTIAVPYTQELAAASREHGSLAEGFGQLVGDEMAGVIRHLPSAQFRLVRTLDEAGLAALIHNQYDPNHLISDTVGMNRSTAWPAEIDARAVGHVAARSWSSQQPWYSATAWVKQLPTQRVRLNFLAPLLLWMDQVTRTVTVVMDLVPADKAIDRAMSDLTNERGQGQAGAGKINDPRNTQAMTHAEQTMHDATSGAAGITLTSYITVTARSEKDLAKVRRETVSAASKSQIKLEWCEREQHRAFVNTLPLAAGLISEN